MKSLLFCASFLFVLNSCGTGDRPPASQAHESQVGDSGTPPAPRQPVDTQLAVTRADTVPRYDSVAGQIKQYHTWEDKELDSLKAAKARKLKKQSGQ